MADNVKKITHCTIGIPARNEENTIYSMLLSVLDSIQLVLKSRQLQCEVIIALNGCTDSTEDVVRSFISKFAEENKIISFRILFSQEGIVEAQKAICHARNYQGPIFFFDADTILEEHCLLHLIEALEGVCDAEIVWAPPKPVMFPRGKFPNMRRILNFSDFFPDVLTTRRYLYGKAYGLRSCELLLDIPPIASKTHVPEYRVFQLDKGPLVDDIYLTREAVAKYGIESIRVVESAMVFFSPIETLHDFYYSQRRTIFEMKRLDILFPYQSYSKSKDKYLKRQIVKPAFDQLPMVHKVEFFLYHCLYKCARMTARAELFFKLNLARMGVPIRPVTVWPAVKSTKRNLLRRL